MVLLTMEKKLFIWFISILILYASRWIADKEIAGIQLDQLELKAFFD